MNRERHTAQASEQWVHVKYYEHGGDTRLWSKPIQRKLVVVIGASAPKAGEIHDYMCTLEKDVRLNVYRSFCTGCVFKNLRTFSLGHVKTTNSHTHTHDNRYNYYICVTCESRAYTIIMWGYSLCQCNAVASIYSFCGVGGARIFPLYRLLGLCLTYSRRVLAKYIRCLFIPFVATKRIFSLLWCCTLRLYFSFFFLLFSSFDSLLFSFFFILLRSCSTAMLYVLITFWHFKGGVIIGSYWNMFSLISEINCNRCCWSSMAFKPQTTTEEKIC